MISQIFVHPILKSTNETLLSLPSPSFISYLWNFGSMLGIILIIQIVSGLLISIFYLSETSFSFFSIIHCRRDVIEGWIFRFVHSNGASLFFIFLYRHILIRGIYFKSYIINSETWSSGIILLLIFIGTAFLGYVLPWGQISFWGATVITNILSVLPYIGQSLIIWVWGGFSVGEPTLTRFFSLHFVFPFISLGVVLIHLILLHMKGSSSPVTSRNLDKLIFNFFFSIKDLITIILLVFILIIVCIFYPFIFGDPENYNQANPLSTPIHIQPEWYFLFAYAILRSIPSKLGGAIALVLSIFIFFLLIFSTKKKSSLKFSIYEKLFLREFLIMIVLLTWIGANPVEFPLILLGQIFSFLYFLSFLFIV